MADIARQRQHKTPDNDRDVQNFQNLMSGIITRLCHWAKSASSDEITAWFKLPPDEAEISRSMRSFLLQETTTPEYLEKQFWAAIPLRTQQFLGRQDLQVLDLLDLPKVSEDCAHFLVYLDVLTKLPPGLIKRRPRSGRTVLTMKTPAMGVDVKATAIEACVYGGSSRSNRGGSSRSNRGGGFRIYEHLKNANRNPDQDSPNIIAMPLKRMF